MNLLLFEEHELVGQRLQLAGRRAEHIINILGLREGDSLRVGMVDGMMGAAKVTNLGADTVGLDVNLDRQPPVVPDIELILALPRPIMLQRILKQATVMGVRRFHLIRSNRVQKSFFQSHLLHPDNYREILIQGLEQGMHTKMPEVHLYKRFMPFVEDVVPTLNGSSRLLAHPEQTDTLPDLYLSGNLEKSVMLAVGPEGGWIDHEVEQFRKQGFHCFSMGDSILHVDTAVVVLISQIQVLQALLNR